MVQKVRLVPDRRHLRDVGQLNNHNNYWIDVQLQSEGKDTRDFVATYVFDSDGKLISHNIIDLGLRSDPKSTSAATIIAQERGRLGLRKTFFGRRKRSDFWVRPFSVEAHGLVFGLVVRERDEAEPENILAVDALPGLTIMFHPPWPEGLYDT